jgi:hypothetical protein
VAQSDGVATPESILAWIDVQLSGPAAKCPECVLAAFGDQSPKACEEMVQVCLDYLVEEKVLHLAPAGVYTIHGQYARELTPLVLV